MLVMLQYFLLLLYSSIAKIIYAFTKCYLLYYKVFFVEVTSCLGHLWSRICNIPFQLCFQGAPRGGAAGLRPTDPVPLCEHQLFFCQGNQSCCRIKLCKNVLGAPQCNIMATANWVIEEGEPKGGTGSGQYCAMPMFKVQGQSFCLFIN